MYPFWIYPEAYQPRVRTVVFYDLDLFAYCSPERESAFRSDCLVPNWETRLEHHHREYGLELARKQTTRFNPPPPATGEDLCYWSTHSGLVTRHGSTFFCPNLFSNYSFGVIPSLVTETPVDYPRSFIAHRYYCEGGEEWQDVPMFYWANDTHVIIANFANITKFSQQHCMIIPVSVSRGKARWGKYNLRAYFKRPHPHQDLLTFIIVLVVGASVWVMCCICCGRQLEDVD